MRRGKNLQRTASKPNKVASHEHDQKLVWDWIKSWNFMEEKIIPVLSGLVRRSIFMQTVCSRRDLTAGVLLDNSVQETAAGLMSQWHVRRRGWRMESRDCTCNLNVGWFGVFFP